MAKDQQVSRIPVIQPLVFSQSRQRQNTQRPSLDDIDPLLSELFHDTTVDNVKKKKKQR
jgi:hypothetical protein